MQESESSMKRRLILWTTCIIRDAIRNAQCKKSHLLRMIAYMRGLMYMCSESIDCAVSFDDHSLRRVTARCTEKGKRIVACREGKGEYTHTDSQAAKAGRQATRFRRSKERTSDCYCEIFLFIFLSYFFFFQSIYQY